MGTRFLARGINGRRLCGLLKWNARPRLAADPSLSRRFIEVVRNLTRDERASFLLKYAAAFGRAFPRRYDSHGFKMPLKRRRKPKPPEPLDDAL